MDSQQQKTATESGNWIDEVERLKKLLANAHALDESRVKSLAEQQSAIQRLTVLDGQRLSTVESLQKTIDFYVNASESGKAHDRERVSTIELLTFELGQMRLLDAERVNKIQQMAADYEVLHKVNQKLAPFARGKQIGDAPPVVIVNSLPKTGSMTVWKSLCDPAFGLLMHHHHAISDQGIAQTLVAAKTYPLTAEEHLQLLIKVQRAANARMDMINEYARTDGRTPFFVSGLREPVSLFLSFMFQVGFQRTDDRGPVSGPIDLDRLISRMQDWFSDPSITLYPYLPGPEAWLNREVKEFLHIDPLAESFDTQSGFQVYKSPRASLLLYRMEDLDRVFHTALEALLGPIARKVEQIDTNRSSDKAYFDDYDHVMKNLIVPEQLLDQIYGGKYARTFYSPGEIEALRRKWSARRS